MIVTFSVFLNLQFNGHTTKQNGTTKQRQSTMSLEEKRLHEELINGSTNSTSHKHPKRTQNFSEGNISLHVSLPEAQRNWAGKWHSVREFIYCETFIIGVDEFSFKLFSIVFTTFNLYYWLTIFYFYDSVI